MNQLNLQMGLERQYHGINLVIDHNLTWIQQMRKFAKSHCRSKYSVSSDNLRIIADRLNFHPDSPHAWGAIFRGRNWECIGRMKSGYITNNAREIKVWKYVSGPVK